MGMGTYRLKELETKALNTTQHNETKRDAGGSTWQTAGSWLVERQGLEGGQGTPNKTQVQYMGRWSHPGWRIRRVKNELEEGNAGPQTQDTGETVKQKVQTNATRRDIHKGMTNNSYSFSYVLTYDVIDAHCLWLRWLCERSQWTGNSGY